ncbi:MAG TPA: hypothetical protein VMV04_11370 [Thermodesulfobacteriota bacterium]|nr:hypothetical protein [Thermodesulfobacteriota bacterium]
MDKNVFNPEKYKMAICPYCNGQGHIQHPNRQCCPNCGGFGYTKKEGEKENSTPNGSGNQG